MAAGYLAPRPKRADQSDEEYAAYIRSYRAQLLRDNPWLEDDRPGAFWKFTLRQLFVPKRWQRTVSGFPEQGDD